MDKYNHFQEDLDILNYVDKGDNIIQAIILCLKSDFIPLSKQNLFIFYRELILYPEEIKDFKIIEFAIEKESKDFLKFIWENQAKNMLSKKKTITRINRNYTKTKNKLLVKSKTYIEFNFKSKEFCKSIDKEFEITPTDLINNFKKSKFKNLIFIK